MAVTLEELIMNDPDSKQDSLRLDELREYCKRKELIAIYPKREHVLLLDLDDTGKWDKEPVAEKILKCPIERSLKLESRNGGGLHVYVEPHSALIEEGPVKYLLQAALGSDPVREFLSGLRYSGEDNDFPNVLFEKPDFMKWAVSQDPKWRLLLGVVPME